MAIVKTKMPDGLMCQPSLSVARGGCCKLSTGGSKGTALDERKAHDAERARSSGQFVVEWVKMGRVTRLRKLFG